FGLDPLKFILVNGYPGFSLFGFVLGAIIAMYLYFASRKVKFLEVVDYFIPSALLSLGMGKLGSFFSGVEPGTKTKFLLAIKYAGYDGNRHLTPLYEALLFFLGAFLSYKLLFAI